MKSAFLLLLFVFPFLIHAQVNRVSASIVNPGSLISTYDFTEDNSGLRSLIQSEGAGKLMNDILRYSQEDQWPEGLKSLDSRLDNREQFFDFTVYKLAANGDYTILVMPASENQTIDELFKPVRDIYFIFESSGVNFEGNTANVVEEEIVEEYMDEYVGYGDTLAYEEQESYDTDESDAEVVVAIVEPGDIFSTFNMQDNQSAHEALVESGILDEEQFSYLSIKATENSWPSGIATLSERIKNRELFKQYVAYFAAVFGVESEYVLIWIPLYGNEHMPENMQPVNEEGFYFIVKSSGVAY